MNNLSRMMWVGGVVACLAIPVKAGPWKGQVQGGVGYWAGETIYSIGGSAWTPQDGTIELPDKISELKFPLNVACGVVEGSLFYHEQFELHGEVMANLTDPSTKVTDSDFGLFGSSTAGRLDVYSESDATLSATAVDVGLRYWIHDRAVSNRIACAVGFGPTLVYQRTDWTIGNLDQWYPSNPMAPHDREPGQVGTYMAEILMPCMEVSVMARYKAFSGRVTVAAGPALIRDEDNHMLTQKRSTGELTGIGAKSSADLQYNLTKNLFLRGQVNVLSIQAFGTQTQRGYGGDNLGFYGEIDETFSSATASANVAVGCAF